MCRSRKRSSGSPAWPACRCRLPPPTPRCARNGARRCYDVMELAAKFFEATLAARAGAHARGYLADRGIEPATQLQFRLGYAPAERFALKEHLGAHGISVDDMVEAGLLVTGDDIPLPYDRFRDRVMFPITDLRGRVIAFGGRALQKDAQREISQLARDAALPQGRDALQPCRRARRRAPGRARGRGRGLCRRHRAGDGRLSGCGRAARDRVDRGPAGAVVEDGGRAGAVLRRRPGWPACRLSGGRSRAERLSPGKSLRFAVLPPGQDPDDLARSGGARGDGRGFGERAAALRHAVGARDRGRQLRHARAAGRPGGAPRRHPAKHRRRDGAKILPGRPSRPDPGAVRTPARLGRPSGSVGATNPAQLGGRRQQRFRAGGAPAGPWVADPMGPPGAGERRPRLQARSCGARAARVPAREA